MLKVCEFVQRKERDKHVTPVPKASGESIGTKEELKTRRSYFSEQTSSLKKQKVIAMKHMTWFEVSNLPCFYYHFTW